MKRRNFLKGIIAAPLVVKAIMANPTTGIEENLVEENLVEENLPDNTGLHDITDQLIKYIQHNRPFFNYERVKTPAFIVDGKSYVVRSRKMRVNPIEVLENPNFLGVGSSQYKDVVN